MNGSTPNGSWNTNTVPSIDYAKCPIEHLYTLKATELGPVDFITVRDRLLAQWEITKKTLERAKEVEMELRKINVAFLSDPAKHKGTENVELGGGYKATMVKKINYGFVKNADGKIDKHAIDDALDAIEEKIESGKLIAERLIKWTPDLSLTEYNQLPDAAKAIIDKVIVTTDAAPTLEIKAPKAAK